MKHLRFAFWRLLFSLATAGNDVPWRGWRLRLVVWTGRHLHQARRAL